MRRSAIPWSDAKVNILARTGTSWILKLSIINLDFVTLLIFRELKSKLPSSKPLMNLYFLTKGLALSEWNVVTTLLSFWVIIEINSFSLLLKFEFKFKSKIFRGNRYL